MLTWGNFFNFIILFLYNLHEIHVHMETIHLYLFIILPGILNILVVFIEKSLLFVLIY